MIQTPPFLLLAVLLFWGWQSDLLGIGVAMGVILESARFIKARWDLSDEDFRRILMFCTVLALATAVYAFIAAEPDRNGSLFRGPAAFRNVTFASVRISHAFFRWLPMTLFFFVAAQQFSTRTAIPWSAISLSGRRRRAHNSGAAAAPSRPAQDPFSEGRQPEIPTAAGGLNATYPYFIVCLFAAGMHANDGSGAFFWEQAALVVWALWPFRSRRFRISVWVSVLAAAMALGFSNQQGISRLQQFLENANAQWIARFLRSRTDPTQATTAIGQIGQRKLSGCIVIRLRTENDQPPPVYLREASYRIFHSAKQSWFAGNPHHDFENVFPETNQTTFILVPGRTNPASVHIACYLPGGQALLPLPTDCGRLDRLNVYILQKNSEGAVLAEGPGLVIFDARYGPGATRDAPPDTRPGSPDLEVPPALMPALRQVLEQLPVAGAAEDQQLRAVAAFFADHFTYGVWQPEDSPTATNQMPLADFLLHHRQGHCEYFATATVLLLRQLKIPARYAVGFYVHERSGSGWVVRERDAHAWCLVWNRQTKTWEDFDTTPATWIEMEEARASPWQWLSDCGSWLGFQIAKLRWGQARWREYILWSLIPVLILLLYQILFQHRRSRKKSPSPKSSSPVFRPGSDSEFYQLERQLVRRGAPRQADEPLSLWLVRATDTPSMKNLRQPLTELLRLHYRHRFDPHGLSREERQALAHGVKKYLETLPPPPAGG